MHDQSGAATDGEAASGAHRMPVSLDLSSDCYARRREIWHDGQAMGEGNRSRIQVNSASGERVLPSVSHGAGCGGQIVFGED